jgi:hypothetical protein
MVYPINNQKFFNGNVEIQSGSDSKGYLLPLSNKFFEYFDSEDLIEFGSNKPRINLTQINDSVKVVLQIPISKSGEFISFERIYFSSENDNRTPEIDRNKGLIVEHQVGITVFPLLKPGNSGIEPHYRIQLIDRNITGLIKNSDYLLEFFDNKIKEPIKILNELNNVIEILINNVEKKIVFGSRVKLMHNIVDRSNFRHIIGRVFCTVTTLLLKLNIYDTQCGLKIFSKELSLVFVKEKFISRWLFDIEIFLRIIKEIGIKKTINCSYEMPVHSWIEKGNTKIKFSYFIIAPFDLFKIYRHYKN